MLMIPLILTDSPFMKFKISLRTETATTPLTRNKISHFVNLKNSPSMAYSFSLSFFFFGTHALVSIISSISAASILTALPHVYCTVRNKRFSQISAYLIRASRAHSLRKTWTVKLARRFKDTVPSFFEPYQIFSEKERLPNYFARYTFLSAVPCVKEQWVLMHQ